jgi:hypothetical protein
MDRPLNFMKYVLYVVFVLDPTRDMYLKYINCENEFL